jgi:hypothetical protein
MKKSTRAIYLKDQKFSKAFCYIEDNRNKWPIKKYYLELLKLSKIAPDELAIQTWYASILGDYGQTLSLAKELAYKQKAVKILTVVSRRIVHESDYMKMWVFNELFYHSQKFKNQYDLGQKHESLKKGSGLFSMGVGGAEYAYQLFQKGQKKRSIQYAVSSLDAWNILSDGHRKFNPFYILALALTGEYEKAKNEMNLLVKEDPDYSDFKRFLNVYKKRILAIERAELK